MRSSPRAVAGGIALLVYLVIFLLSSLPASVLPSHVPDYIPHFLEFFALAFFSVQAFAKPGRARALALAFLLSAILGMLDEWHQLAVPGRVCSWQDWAYDLCGALVGLAAFRTLEQMSLRPGCAKIARILNFLLLNRKRT
jgi:VanZ family protein